MSRPPVDELVTDLRLSADLFADSSISSMTGDAVSELIVNLAAKRTYLGEYVAYYQRDADLAEAHYEQTREEAYRAAREAGRSGVDADSAKRLAAVEPREAAIKAKYQATLVKNLWNDIDNLIDTLRSRLSYLKSEANQ